MWFPYVLTILLSIIGAGVTSILVTHEMWTHYHADNSKTLKELRDDFEEFVSHVNSRWSGEK